MKTLTILFTILILSLYSFRQSPSSNPPPNLDIIQVPDSVDTGKMIDCPLEGSARNVTTWRGHLEWIGNPKKNRYDIPDSGMIHTVSIEDLIASNAGINKFKEGAAVCVTGYVDTVKPGGHESCNCQTIDDAYTDTHIELVPDPSKTGKKYRLIVEITPRLRMLMNDKNVDWSTEALFRDYWHQKVTVQGWLFFDAIHKGEDFVSNPTDKPVNGIRHNFRASLWEVHPVTSIELVEP